MGRVVRFEFFTNFYVYLPFTKAQLPCPLVMAGVGRITNDMAKIFNIATGAFKIV